MWFTFSVCTWYPLTMRTFTAAMLKNARRHMVERRSAGLMNAKPFSVRAYRMRFLSRFYIGFPSLVRTLIFMNMVAFLQMKKTADNIWACYFFLIIAPRYAIIIFYL